MFIQVDHKGSIEIWTIRRPERRNALGMQIGLELKAELTRLLGRIEEVTVLVLRAAPCPSAEGEIWIAGGDLKELKGLDAAGAKEYADLYAGFCGGLLDLPIPVITAVEGQAIGGGAELALFGDIRLATMTSSLVFKQLKVGLTPGYGGGQRLRDLVGLSVAQRAFFLTECFGAEEMVRLGMMHRMVRDGAEMGRCLEEICAAFVGIGRVPLKQMKKILRQEEGYAEEKAIFLGTWRNPAHVAFLESWG